jgi:serine/threonine protein kinase
MLCGYLPFEDENVSVLYKKILEGDYKFHRKVSEQAKDLIRKMLTNNPN